MSRKSRPELTIIDSCEVAGGEGAEVSQAVVNCYNTPYIFCKEAGGAKKAGQGARLRRAC